MMTRTATSQDDQKMSLVDDSGNDCVDDNINENDKQRPFGRKMTEAVDGGRGEKIFHCRSHHLSYISWTNLPEHQHERNYFFATAGNTAMMDLLFKVSSINST